MKESNEENTDDHRRIFNIAKNYLSMKKIHITYNVKGSTEESVVTEWTVIFDKNFVKQKDEWNCGPIACLSVLEMFYDKKILDKMEEIKNYRTTVMNHFRTLMAKHKDDIQIYDGTRKL